MSAISTPEERFKNNLNTMLDIIIDMFEEGSENSIVSGSYKVLPILKFLVSRSNGERIINNFINRTHEYWDKMRTKDINYFKDFGLDLFTDMRENGMEQYNPSLSSYKEIIDNLSSSHVEDFKKVLEASYKDEDGNDVDIFDEERKEDIWKILGSFVKISVVFVHEKRKYKDGKYTEDYCPFLNVRENVDKWGIKSVKF